MNSVYLAKHGAIAEIILNRESKHNAFDDDMIALFREILAQIDDCKSSRVMVLRSHGKHFSAGADLNWMHRMKSYSVEENLKDAKNLACLLSELHHHRLPSVAIVQGAAYGGGAGLVSACDIAIGGQSSQFCFSEAKLGLIPSVISPYVIKAVGSRLSQRLFLTAEVFNASLAYNYNLLSEVVKDDELLEQGLNVASTIAANGPLATQAVKRLVNDVVYQNIESDLIDETATRIAEIRISEEGQEGLTAFLDKRKPSWSL